MKTNTLLALVTLSGISGVGCGTNPSAGPLAETSTGTGTSSGTNTAVSTSTETAKTETAANTETKTASEEKEKKPEAKKEDEKKPSKPTLALDQTKLTFADVVRSIGSDEKTLKFTSDLDIPDLNITVTSGSATTNTSAGPFLITSSCSSIKKGETCTITIKASGTTVGSSTGALKVGTKSGAELASVDLAVDVTMMGVKKVTPQYNGIGYIFNDGTAKMWGELVSDSSTGVTTRVIPNAGFRSSISSTAMSGNKLYVQAMPVVLPDNAKVVDMAWVRPTNGCAIDDQKRLVCWGQAKSMNGSAFTSIALVPEVVATGAVSLGMAGNMACYLDVNGKAWCLGQVFLGNDTPGYTDVNPSGSAYTLIPRAAAPTYSFDYLTVSSTPVICGKVKSEEKVVCVGYFGSYMLDNSGSPSHLAPFELNLSKYQVVGPIKDIQIAGSSICILSDSFGCTGSGNNIGQSSNSVYQEGFRPFDPSGAKIQPTKIWGQTGSYCAQETNRVLCWGVYGGFRWFNEFVFGTPFMYPTVQTIDPGFVAMTAVGSSSPALVGKFTIKSSHASFNAANNWGQKGYTEITADDPAVCLTQAGSCN